MGAHDAFVAQRCAAVGDLDGRRSGGALERRTAAEPSASAWLVFEGLGLLAIIHGGDAATSRRRPTTYVRQLAAEAVAAGVPNYEMQLDSPASPGSAPAWATTRRRAMLYERVVEGRRPSRSTVGWLADRPRPAPARRLGDPATAADCSTR